MQRQVPSILLPFLNMIAPLPPLPMPMTVRTPGPADVGGSGGRGGGDGNCRAMDELVIYSLIVTAAGVYHGNV